MTGFQRPFLLLHKVRSSASSTCSLSPVRAFPFQLEILPVSTIYSDSWRPG